MRVGVTVPAVPMTTVTVPPVPAARPPGSAVLRCAVPGSGLAAARPSVTGGPVVALPVPAGSGARRLPVFRGVRG